MDTIANNSETVVASVILIVLNMVVTGISSAVVSIFASVSLLWKTRIMFVALSLSARTRTFIVANSNTKMGKQWWSEENFGENFSFAALVYGKKYAD